MTLPSLLTSFGEYVADAIETDAGQEGPERLLRYATKVPDDCCTEAGTLGVWWLLLEPTDNFPIGLSFKGNMAGAWPMVTLGARWATCWPEPKATENGIVTIDPEWDSTAARLALVAEAVSVRLMQLTCTVPGDPLREAVLGEVGCSLFRFRDCTPDVSGGCAGLTFRCYAALGGSQAT